MAEDLQSVLPDDITPAEAIAELERVLADVRFHVSDRNKAFLRYIADQCLSGNPKGPKGYVIAVDVFGRPSSFDPYSDPIVRTEAARLRASLDRYYEAHGTANQVRVSLPRGNYVAQFRRIPKDTPASDDASLVETLPPRSVAAANKRTPLFFRGQHSFATFANIVAALGVCLVLGFQLLIFHPDRAPNRSASEPLVTINVIQPDQAERARAENVDEGLTFAVLRPGNLQLTADPPDSLSRPPGNIPSMERLKARRYVLILEYGIDGDGSKEFQTDIEQPLEPAKQSVVVAPISDRNSRSKTIASFARGKLQMAVSTGDAILISNTYDLETATLAALRSYRSSSPLEDKPSAAKVEGISPALGQLPEEHIAVEAADQKMKLDQQTR